MNKCRIFVNCILLTAMIFVLTACCHKGNLEEDSNSKHRTGSVETEQIETENTADKVHLKNDKKSPQKGKKTDEKVLKKDSEISVDYLHEKDSSKSKWTYKYSSDKVAQGQNVGEGGAQDKNINATLIQSEDNNDSSDDDNSNNVPANNGVTPFVVPDDTVEKLSDDIMINDDGTVELPFVAVE